MPLSYVDVLVDEEEEDDEQNKKKKEEDAKENRMLIFSFSKAKKRIVSKIRRKPLSLNMSSSSLPSASASASSGFWKYVCFCGIESPSTLEWSSSSNSGSKDDNFTIEMLRVLIQTNDFFSEDCNPHL